MSNKMKYKDYEAIIEFDSDNNGFIGTTIGLNDTIIFEGDSTEELEKTFQEAIEGYLATCKAVGKDPEKVYKGLFNVRTNPEIHGKLARLADIEDCSLNKIVNEALIFYLSNRERREVYEVQAKLASTLKERKPWNNAGKVINIDGKKGVEDVKEL